MVESLDDKEQKNSTKENQPTKNSRSSTSGYVIHTLQEYLFRRLRDYLQDSHGCTPTTQLSQSGVRIVVIIEKLRCHTIIPYQIPNGSFSPLNLDIAQNTAVENQPTETSNRRIFSAGMDAMEPEKPFDLVISVTCPDLSFSFI